MDIYERIKELGIILPPPPPLGGIYFQAKEFGDNLCYISGAGPNIPPEGTKYNGKLGCEYTVEDGYEAARCTALNMIAVINKNIGDLNRINKIVKLLCFVASADDFYEQPAVANGASQLFIDIFGESAGKASRSAIGVNVLPENIPFEMEALIELKQE